MKTAQIVLGCLVSATSYAQVVDVDGDEIVGAEEVLAVAEQWKGVAAASNEHDHLGQTWRGDTRALTIMGDFPDRLVFTKNHKQVLPIEFNPSGAMNLDNTAFGKPDLHLDGVTGVVGAMQESNSSLAFHSNESVTVYLNRDNVGNPGAFNVRAPNGDLKATIGESGNTTIYGNLDVNGSFEYGKSGYRIDHPLEPASKYLVHSSVGSSEDLNVYSGTVLLDGAGEAWVGLPSYLEALNTDFRYQLTLRGRIRPGLCGRGSTRQPIQDCRRSSRTQGLLGGDGSSERSLRQSPSNSDRNREIGSGKGPLCPSRSLRGIRG